MLKHLLYQSKSFIRFQHCTAISLTNRALIQVQGTDSSKFLQGLITNDIEFLKSTNAIYSMLLNARGRILYDMIIYKHAQQDSSSYLIEISRQAVADFLRLLRRYKLRTQVSFEDVTEMYRIWSIFATANDLRENLNFKTRQDLIIGQSDPRHSSLGIRLVTEKQTELNQLVDLAQISDDVSLYKQWLYRNGVAEGIEDIPPGECIPLEYNIVFLNGVSFNKGCYVGQELVARTHHTGVIRKRIMPVEIENYGELSKSFENKIEDLTIINDETKRRAGRLRTSIQKYGLGLIRLSEWKSPLRIQNADVKIKPSIPNWWPTLDEATRLEMKLDTSSS